MMYPFLTLDDGAEIVHSERKQDGQVKVNVEKPDDRDFFHNAVCWLPGFRWEEVNSFSQGELERYDEVVRSVAQRILDGSRGHRCQTKTRSETFG